MTKRTSSSARKSSKTASSGAHAEVMTVDAEEFSRAAENVRKSITSKKAALKVLVDAGILTKSGNLRSHYK